MINKQYKAIQKETKKLDELVKRVQIIMFDLLSMAGKDMEICIEDECFSFTPPLNQEEYDRLQQDKCKLITLILRDAFDKYFDEKSDEEVWANVYQLASGADPKNYILKKTHKEYLLKTPAHGVKTDSGHIAIPIDEDGYQAQQEIERLKQLFDKEIEEDKK